MQKIRRWWWLAALAAVALAGGLVYWLDPALIGLGSSGGSPQQTASRGKPVVAVTTVPVQHKTLTTTATAYGRVVAQPGATRVRSIPFETAIQHVLVTEGQPVATGTPLIALSSSPAAKLRLEKALDAYIAAEQEYRPLKELYKKRLVKKKQVVDARKAAEQAKAEVQKLKKEGVGQDLTLKAKAPGVVTKISASEGALVKAGASLISIATGDRIEAKIGVEPEDIHAVHKGDRVPLTPVHLSSSTVVGAVRLVTRRVDPKTQLIDVMVSMPTDANLALGAYVRATLTTASRKGLVVPRAAVLPDKNGHAVFTVRDGHAVRHQVGIGLQTDSEVELSKSDLSAGDGVVVTGNYELAPGTAVTLKGGS